MARSWSEWTGGLLDVPDDERAAAASAVLTVVDGLLLVRFVTDGPTADRAADWLAEHLR